METTSDDGFLKMRRELLDYSDDVFFMVADLALGRQGLLEPCETEKMSPEERELFENKNCAKFSESLDYFLLGFFEFDFLRSKNPIYVWKSIHYCRSKPQIRFRILEDLASEKLQFQGKQSPDRKNLFSFFYELCADVVPIPDWCVEYITECASNVSELYNASSVATQKRVERIPRIFGFIRKGWNAFEAHERDAESEQLLRAYEELVHKEGLSKSQAKKTILEGCDLSDERNLHRALLRRVPYQVAKRKV